MPPALAGRRLRPLFVVACRIYTAADVLHRVFLGTVKKTYGGARPAEKTAGPPVRRVKVSVEVHVVRPGAVWR